MILTLQRPLQRPLSSPNVDSQIGRHHHVTVLRPTEEGLHGRMGWTQGKTCWIWCWYGSQILNPPMVPKPTALWEVYVPIIPRASRRTALTLPLSEEEWGSAHLVAAQDHLQNKAYQRKTSGKAMVFHWNLLFSHARLDYQAPIHHHSTRFGCHWKLRKLLGIGQMSLNHAACCTYEEDKTPMCRLAKLQTPRESYPMRVNIMDIYFMCIKLYIYTYIFLYLSMYCFIGLCNDIHIMQCISLCPWSNTHAITFGHQLPVEAFCQLHQPTVFHWSVELLPGKFKPSRTGRF